MHFCFCSVYNIFSNIFLGGLVVNAEYIAVKLVSIFILKRKKDIMFVYILVQKDVCLRLQKQLALNSRYISLVER